MRRRRRPNGIDMFASFFASFFIGARRSVLCKSGAEWIRIAGLPVPNLPNFISDVLRAFLCPDLQRDATRLHRSNTTFISPGQWGRHFPLSPCKFSRPILAACPPAEHVVRYLARGTPASDNYAQAYMIGASSGPCSALRSTP